MTKSEFIELGLDYMAENLPKVNKKAAEEFLVGFLYELQEQGIVGEVEDDMPDADETDVEPDYDNDD